MNPASLLRSLLSWYESREDLHFVMYSRASCHLCDVAWEELQTAQQRYRFALEKRDVDANPALAAKHGECVPVVTVNGKVRFRGAVNPVLLRRLLNAYGERDA